jgi:hypothetical protein
MPDDADIRRTIDEAEQTIERARQQILETDAVLAQARLERWERYLCGERRQGWFDWSNHLFFGFVDMLKFVGLWTLVNVVLVVATTPSMGVSTVPRSDLDFQLAVMLGVFAFAWVVAVAYRWFKERQRILARHRRILTHLQAPEQAEQPEAGTVRLSRPVRAVMEVLLEAAPEDPPWGYQICVESQRGPGSVYPALEQLEDAKWIVGTWGEPGPEGEPKRRTYRATEEGAVAYQAALAELEARKASKRHWLSRKR